MEEMLIPKETDLMWVKRFILKDDPHLMIHEAKEIVKMIYAIYTVLKERQNNTEHKIIDKQVYFPTESKLTLIQQFLSRKDPYMSFNEIQTVISMLYAIYNWLL